MKDVKFRFAPEIFIRLGEELNPSPSGGLIELIRNSYDADSSVCTVHFEYYNYKNVISIVDDGNGMSLDDIRNGWFILGKSKKSKKRTRLGRIPIGDKGLGRLAALRLGKEVTITTRCIDTPNVQNSFHINWSDYKNIETIDQIEFEVDQTRSENPPGTEITISDVTAEFGRREIKKLAREMVLLADPFGEDPHGFQPKLKIFQHRDLENLVLHRYFDQAELILNLDINEDGKAFATVTDYHGQELYQGDHSDIKGNDKKYKCPSLKFNLWIYILAAEKFVGRIARMSEVKQWLGEFGGIHVYQNNMRVGPYGDRGNDWLELNLLRSRSPELMPSTNTSIGKISISENDLLVQKTDRSGFIESEAFNEIKDACTDTLKWMQKRRIEQRDKQARQEKLKLEKEKEKSRQSIDEEISALPKQNRLALRRKFAEYEKKRDKKERNLQREVQLSRTLSTAGIAAALFSHESANNPIQLIKSNTRAVKRKLQKLLSAKKYDEQFLRPIERILRSADALSVLSTFTLSIVEADKRREQKVFIHKTINEILDQFSLFLIARKIKYEIQFDNGNPFYNGNIATIEAVVANLLANSIQAFERKSIRQRKIVIKTIILDGGFLEIHILDNGPGIKDISIHDIWLPGETTRKKGTGLGLAIVRDSVIDIGGTVEAKAEGELGGAGVIVRLPIIGA